jgi:hypothetical protein
MCELVRRHQPGATIVVGGHLANRPGLRALVDADHVVRGEGVAWFRAFLGEDVSAPVRHPLLRAFQRDFEQNGPSVARIARTLLRGWLALKHHPDPRVRERIAFETKGLATQYAAALWASERWFARTNPALAARLRATRDGIEQEFGWKARVAARVAGPLVLASLALEERRLRRGRTYEPPTFYEANPAAAARAELRGRGAAACRWVEPSRPRAEASEAVA